MGSEQKLTTPPIGGDSERVTGDFSGGQGKTYVFGTTVPPDGTEGYAKGCVFILTSGGANTTFNVNEGTLESSAFAAK